MFNSTLTIVVLLYATVPAVAAWQLHTGRDRLNDRDTKIANLEAKEVDNGVTAVIHAMCHQGKPLFALRTSHDLDRSQNSASYRIDEQPSQMMTFDFSDQRTMIFREGLHLANARRFRVQFKSAEKALLFYDFDLNGIGTAIRAVGCP